MDYISFKHRGQVVVAAAEEILQDNRFSWRERKEKTVKLYELYEKAGYPEYAARTRDCGTFLQFGDAPEGGRRRLRAANFCKQRLCPMCISRRARRAAWMLSRILDRVERDHQAKFIFLTLTIANVTGPELGEALSLLTKSWYRFVDQRQIERSFPGWFRAIEITSKRIGGVVWYHPHIHAICAVDADYFSHASRVSGKYLNQRDLIVRWQKALRVDYRPSVRIQTTRGSKGEGEVLAAGGGKAAAEAGKYAVKDDEYIDPRLPVDRAVEILRDYTEALYKRRLTGFGGWFKIAARELDMEDLEDGDLVHVDDEGMRPDVAEVIETYHWRFGVGDYVLASREINPLWVKAEPVREVPEQPAEVEEPDKDKDLTADMHQFWLYDDKSPWED